MKAIEIIDANRRINAKFLVTGIRLCLMLLLTGHLDNSLLQSSDNNVSLISQICRLAENRADGTPTVESL
jgi:hypothetical protein